MKSRLSIAKYDTTQKLLDEATLNLNKYAATIRKLDGKYQRDEEDIMRCQLLIDGVKEQGSKRPKTVVINLLKDLEVEFSEADIKSAYRLGPLNDKSSRPRSIKVQFVNNHFKYEIFKNIQKPKGKEIWKGIHIGLRHAVYLRGGQGQGSKHQAQRIKCYY